MRLSTFRLWISLGFGLIVTEAALIVFLFLRTTRDISSLEKSVRDLKKENDQQSLEIRTLQDRLGRARKTTGEPEDTGATTRTNESEAPLGLADWIRKYREAGRDTDGERIAARAIRGFGSRGLDTAISAYYSESDLEVKRRLAHLIGSFIDAAALVFLEDALSLAADRELRLEILAGIKEQSGSPRLAKLGEALERETDPDVLKAIVEVVRKGSSDEATALLTRRYASLATADRAAYLSYLVGYKRPPIRVFFERCLRESADPSVRIQAIRGLADCGDPAAVPLLESVRREDANEGVRQEAERAIARLRP